MHNYIKVGTCKSTGTRKLISYTAHYTHTIALYTIAKEQPGQAGLPHHFQDLITIPLNHEVNTINQFVHASSSPKAKITEKENVFRHAPICIHTIIDII